MLLSALISAGNAISRYLFNLSSNAWLEIQWQMFAGIFLLGAAEVLKLNEHVRVDLFYGSAPHRRKLWIDALGIPLFLFPSVLTMMFFSLEFFMSSFRSGEHSSNAGGLLLWPVKFLLPFGLFLQPHRMPPCRQKAFRGEGYLWFQVAEFSFDTFQIRNRTKG
ncbi:MAG: TRAP transporter small permease subunit [Amaricoccus sp.]|uniref:TRAP transporter small permease subunit n=1 Tax=Amaricoccus sp. TaxID=1872485 RepID=UPI0039E6A18B